MKKLVLIITCFIVSNISFGQIVPTNVTNPILSIDMKEGVERPITWHTYRYRNISLGHRITNTYDPPIYLDPHAYLNFQITDDGFNYNNAMVINSKGLVGIGSNRPDELLTVRGTIHCQEVKVDLSVPADYVFEKYYLGFSDLKPNYKMPSLAEIEMFIKENHHLPEMPSAKTIQKDGLQLKEMTNLLLQKIEELTLYTIEQEKRIKVLEAKLNDKK